jgi:uncharacterized membrane protein
MQTFIVRTIVKAYFLGALTLSFMHIVEAANKLHTTGWQIWCWPFMIDGIAVIGMVMRSKNWSSATNKIGFRVQLGAGTLSLAANIYAGNTTGDRMTGIGAVALFLFAEWLSDHMETRQAETKKIETAELEAIAALPSPEELAAQARSERAKKAWETRRKNDAKKARERKAQAKALEALVAA